MKVKLDLPLSISCLIIICFGLLIQFSLSRQSFNLHLVFISLGLIAAFALSYLDVHLLRHFSWHLYFLANALLIITLIFGSTTRGSTRWLDIGFFSLQPSEIAKPLIILAFAQFLTQTHMTKLANLLKLSLMAALPVSLVFIQPDLGSAGIFIITLSGMFFASGIRFRHLFLFLAIGLILTPLAWSQLKDYQQARVKTFLNPQLDPLGKGYNAIQSIIAVGSGQLTGRGLGHGTQSQLRFLPEYKTDFVFASLAEELGLLGSLLLLFAFVSLIWRLFHFASAAHDSFTYLAIVGFAVMFSAHLFVNVGMNLGLFPITGITLPLVSSGGSSIIVSLTSLGLVVSLAQNRTPATTIEIT